MKSRQSIVRVSESEDFEKVLSYCLESGYKNPHGICAESFPVPLGIIVVDEIKKVFFLTNITCMAAAASQGIRPIDAKDFFEKCDQK